MQDKRSTLENSKPVSDRALTERPNATMGPYLFEPVLDKEDIKDYEINLLDYWHILVKRKWTILTFLFITVTAVVIATFLTTPIYRPGLTLQIEREPAKIVQYQSVDTTETDAYQGYESFYKTQYELLQSRSLARRVIDQLGLAENSVFLGKQKQSALTGLETVTKAMSDAQKMEDSEQDKSDLMKQFLSALSVEPVRDSRLVKIYYESPDPELATRILNTLAETYINMNLERRFEASSYARTFLEEHLQQLRAKLEDSERELAQYARRQQIITLDEKQNVIGKTLEELNAALAKTEAEHTKTEADYQQMQRTEGLSLPAILENDVIKKLEETKVNLEAQYQDELNLLKPGYPKMLQLASRINEIQNKINQEAATIRASIRARYESAKTNEALLRVRLNNVKNEAMDLQQRSIQYNTLKREVDTNRQLYDGLLQRYKEVGIAGGVGANNIFVVDKAEVPHRPFKPRFALNIWLAVVIGLCGGVLLAFLFEALDNTIKPDDLERVLGIPMLGMVPLVARAARRTQDSQPLALLACQEPRSAFAESYRSMRTALQFSTVEGSPRILAVTSAVAGEGKTTTALTLAITFAQAGKKVLLIDTDLRNPLLHQIVQIDNSYGLTHYLTADAGPAEIAQPALLPNLFVIPVGPLPPNPVELLSTAKMLALLSLAAEKFDQVILDCPPVLNLADTLILGNMAQATLLVLAAGGTHRGAVQSALKRLRNARVHVLGSVLTKLDIRSHSYPYSYYHYDYYYYSEKSSKQDLAV